MDDDYEDRLDFAARKVQRAYRGRRARQKLKLLIRQNYVKIYDKIGEKYVYKNKMTGEISDQKPKFLGGDDLPTPKQLEAPFDYDPGDDGGEEGFVVILTNNNFPLAPKLAEISPATNADHMLLESAISHDYISRIKLENVTVLKNVSQKEFKEALDVLRRTASKKAFLVVYICSQILTITGGEKKNKKEDGYIAFPETVWTKPPQIARTSLSLTTFADYLNRITCDRKTVILNYAHLRPPKESLFKNTRIAYPPPNFITRLADKAHCAVLASCTVGNSFADILRHTPAIDFATTEYDACEHPLDKKMIDMSRPNTPNPGGGANEDDDNFNYSQYSSYAAIDLHEPGTMNKVESMLMKRCAIEPDKEIKISPQPPDPEAVWVRDESTGYDLRIDLPTEEEYSNFRSKLRIWGVRRFFGRPYNFFKRRFRSYKNKRRCTPKQISIVSDRQTIFCKTIIESISGVTSRPDIPVVTIAEVYGYISNQVDVQLQKLAGDSTGKKTVQTPLLVVPLHNPNAIHNPICYRCGPPPAPEKPYIVRVGRDEVALEWYNPPFDGIQATRYKVYMRNLSRNYNEWRPISREVSVNRYTVKSLPGGVPCQFRVKGYNQGGWGQYSDPSQMVTPGEEYNPLPTPSRWKRLVKGGPLAIVDRLQLYPYHRLDALKGISILNMFGQRQNGYPKTNIAIKVAVVAIHALKTFNEDREIISMSLSLLGWCIKGPAERKVRQLIVQNNVVDIAEKCMEKYRFDSNIINSIAWLRGGMPKYIPQPPPIVTEEDELDESTDSEEEAKNDKNKKVAQKK